MRVLVTGGGGFIGSHLAARLVADGHDVRVLDNFATGRRSNIDAIGGDVELIEGDIQSYERAHNAVRGCEIVFHQAALPSVPRSIQDPLTSNATNVIGTLNILLAARDEGVRRVICASSSSVYGANPTLPKQEDMATMPISPYATAKLAGEGYCRSFGVGYGLQTVALRYFNVFGARQDPTSQYAAVIPNFITALLDGTPLTIFGDGEQSRDFTYVDNVVQANLLAVDAPDVSGRVFNIAYGQKVTLNELVTELQELIGTEAEINYRPRRPGDVPHSLASLERARTELGYEPRIDLREGLTRTIEHYREQRAAAALPTV
jgi:UDP-glucose 4-epimerase